MIRHIQFCVYILSLMVYTSCTKDSVHTDLFEVIKESPSIRGKKEYLNTPYVTAGTRVYMIGHQDGSFPDLGWHIPGEMGGIWNHPIKLMDGFTASMQDSENNASYCLDKAFAFVNYPFANVHAFRWNEEKIYVQRLQFSPDEVEGLVIQFKIINEGEVTKNINFTFSGLFDLRPTWLGERTDMIDAKDTLSFNKALGALIAKDLRNPWFAIAGAVDNNGFTSPHAPTHCATDRTGLGVDGRLKKSVKIKAGDYALLTFVIAGSYQNEAAAIATFNDLRKNYPNHLQQKIIHYQQVAAQSTLDIPDKEVQLMYEWLKYNTEWMVRHVPEHGVGLSAGLPDYPWWFGCDNTYALHGVLATGNHTLVKQTIQLLSAISARVNNGNGRILHEVSTNGEVFNPGNVNETAQFITLLDNYYKWTGDSLLIKSLLSSVHKGIDWLLVEQDPDGNGYPNGSGMMEIHGLDTEMIDVVAYTQQALSAAANLSRLFNDDDHARRYANLANELKGKINRDWWQPQDRSYGDFIGTTHEALGIVKAAMVRADTLKKPWAVAELSEKENRIRETRHNHKQAQVVYRNWVVNTPLETGAADVEKASAALATARQYINPFGVYVTGIDRSNEADSIVLKSRQKTFSYVGAVMTLPTGVQAVASARYGDPDQALDYIHRLNASFSYALPGSMYEVSPDFGMITQAWNIYGVAVPVIQYFFGIEPKAYLKTIRLNPAFPSSWNAGSIKRVKVGNNELSVKYERTENGMRLTIEQTQPDWSVEIIHPRISGVKINGKESNTQQIKIEGNRNQVELTLEM